ncbi:hypothetical protein C2E23DRAFT_733958 [Lenzites betulinus]|nr:hypothetical protein C2E23DRAFT_733958 [Lenzites betulinus]
MSTPLDSPSTVLPAELHELIIDFLHDDWRALVACALTGVANVHSPLVPRAEYHLSRTITIPISGSYEELLEFLKVLQPKSRLASLIRSIHIRGPSITTLEAPKAIFPVLLDLAHLPHLRALTLSYLSVDLTARFTRFLCRLPSLEELSCEGLTPATVLRGGYRGIPDVGPTTQEVDLFCHRLKALRIVGPARRATRLHTADTSRRPNEAILQILERGKDAGAVAGLQQVDLRVDDIAERSRWMAVLCQDNAHLQCIDLTLYETLHLTYSSHAPTPVWDTGSEHFLVCMEQWPSSLTSLHIRYDPWRGYNPDLSSSETIDVFLNLLSHMFAPTTRHNTSHSTHHHDTLQIFELTLHVPLNALADSAVWADLMRSFDHRSRPSLKRVRITLEFLEDLTPREGYSPMLTMSSLALDDFNYYDIVERCAEAVREEFGELGDEMSIEVVTDGTYALR